MQRHKPKKSKDPPPKTIDMNYPAPYEQTLADDLKPNRKSCLSRSIAYPNTTCPARQAFYQQSSQNYTSKTTPRVTRPHSEFRNVTSRNPSSTFSHMKKSVPHVNDQFLNAKPHLKYGLFSPTYRCISGRKRTMSKADIKRVTKSPTRAQPWDCLSIVKKERKKNRNIKILQMEPISIFHVKHHPRRLCVSEVTSFF